VTQPVIVCPVNASAGARAAIAQAATLARVRDEELHLLYVPRERGGPPRRRDGEEEVPSVVADGIQSMLTGVLGRSQRVRYRIRAQPGNPESAIGLYARRHRADLIVISATYRGHGGPAGLSLARRLGRSASCPVLVVAGTMPQGNRAVRASFRHVVCAVDFTKVSVSALEAAAAFAPPSGGLITLAHTFEDISTGMVFSGSEGAQLARAHARQAAAASQRLLRLVPVAVLKRYRVRVKVGSGRPYRLIVGVASEITADLIVMGMPRRSRLAEWLGGSTSRAVLRRAKSPVLLVPA
jgi:nucleotide-binding universal stress UspA family protein